MRLGFFQVILFLIPPNEVGLLISVNSKEADPGFLERGIYMYKGVGVHFADFIIFLSYPMKMK